MVQVNDYILITTKDRNLWYEAGQVVEIDKKREKPYLVRFTQYFSKQELEEL